MCTTSKSVYRNLKLNVKWSVYCCYFVCSYWAAAEWHIDEKDKYVVWQPIEGALRSSAKWFQFKINGESIKSTKHTHTWARALTVFLYPRSFCIYIQNKCTSIIILNNLQSFIFTAFMFQLISVLSWIVAFCLLAKKSWHHKMQHTTHISQWNKYCN